MADAPSPGEAAAKGGAPVLAAGPVPLGRPKRPAPIDIVDDAGAAMDDKFRKLATRPLRKTNGCTARWRRLLTSPRMPTLRSFVKSPMRTAVRWTRTTSLLRCLKVPADFLGVVG